MSALVEEAVTHESKRILKWGWFGGRRGFYEPGLVAKVELRDLGCGWARGHFHSHHHAKNQDDPHQESPRGIRRD
jgi:hypothetical protein